MEVKRQTGFADLSMLLTFALVVCGGDLDTLTTTVSKLTFVEEWVFYCEFIYGRVHGRWIDFERCWKISSKRLRPVLIAKLNLVLQCRSNYPMYATYEEDKHYRKDNWNMHFPTVRPIFHDGSNLDMPTPSDPDLQSAMFSDYYGGCVAKVGVSNQCCGWIRGLDAVTGRMGDSDLIRVTGVLEDQQQFAIDDKSSSEPFLNIFDKGFRLVLDSRRCGQRCLQPVFARSDEQFTQEETLHSACVARIRSGNERAVRLAKKSKFLADRDSDSNWEVELVLDLWLAWTFQVNFMYGLYL
jgi:hypothetical protein